MFSPNELQRYRQQINLQEIGIAGQQTLKEAKVLCIGAGGLGSSLLLYLAAAGIGTLGIVDGDSVEESNLHRQLLYSSSDSAAFKSEAAKARLDALNPNIEVHAYTMRATQVNIDSLILQYDIVADCSDNFYTRYLIHDACFNHKKPYAYASATQFRGHCSLFEGKPCLRCLFPVSAAPGGNCTVEGVLGVSPGVLGLLQASEILKRILKIGDSLHQHLLTVDLLGMEFQKIKLQANPDCSLCG